MNRWNPAAFDPKCDQLGSDALPVDFVSTRTRWCRTPLERVHGYVRRSDARSLYPSNPFPSTPRTNRAHPHLRLYERNALTHTFASTNETRSPTPSTPQERRYHHGFRVHGQQLHDHTPWSPNSQSNPITRERDPPNPPASTSIRFGSNCVITPTSTMIAIRFQPHRYCSPDHSDVSTPTAPLLQANLAGISVLTDRRCRKCG
jgi:hypothetical protein